MKSNHHCHIEHDTCSACRHREIMEMLDFIVESQSIAEERFEEMTAELDALKMVVARVESIEESAIVLIQGIAAQLEAIKDDPAAIAALAADLTASADALAIAVDTFDGDPVVEAPPVVEEPPVVEAPVEEAPVVEAPVEEAPAEAPAETPVA